MITEERKAAAEEFYQGIVELCDCQHSHEWIGFVHGGSLEGAHASTYVCVNKVHQIAAGEWVRALLGEEPSFTPFERKNEQPRLF